MCLKKHYVSPNFKQNHQNGRLVYLPGIHKFHRVEIFFTLELQNGVLANGFMWEFSHCYSSVGYIGGKNFDGLLLKALFCLIIY